MRLTFVVCLCWMLLIPSHAFSASPNGKRIQDSGVGYCGTYPGRTQDELRKSQDLRTLTAARKRKLGLPQRLGATRDVGQIAVIEDDGTIILPNNPFDLTNTVLHVTPAGLGSYTLTRQSGALNTNLGTSLSLTDDAAQQMSFQGGFQFPFFGSSYSSVFVNSDGNITFGQSDTASTDRGVTRFNSGPPRIGGFFADLNPETSPGSVNFNQLSGFSSVGTGFANMAAVAKRRFRSPCFLTGRLSWPMGASTSAQELQGGPPAEPPVRSTSWTSAPQAEHCLARRWNGSPA
jgi:hypothetical protein